MYLLARWSVFRWRWSVFRRGLSLAELYHNMRISCSSFEILCHKKHSFDQTLCIYVLPHTDFADEGVSAKLSIADLGLDVFSKTSPKENHVSVCFKPEREKCD